jgi:hypothetical protein
MSDARKEILELNESQSEEEAPNNSKNSVVAVLDATCSICLEQMKKDIRATIACSHEFWYAILMSRVEYEE